MMKKIFILAISLLVIGCTDNYDTIEGGSNYDIMYKEFTTDDGVNINAKHYKTEGSKGIVLLHMLGSNLEEWDEFASELAERGYSVVAIDFRGHGRSGMNLQDFNASDFNKMKLDAKAATDFLKFNQKKDEIMIIGASIGANVGLRYAAGDNSVGKLILLSPGMNYKGVMTEDIINKFQGRLLLVTSKDDQYAYDSSKKLYGLFEGEKEFFEFEKAGHGTRMLDKVDEKIFKWLEQG